MTDLRTAAKHALEALVAMNPYPASKEDIRNSAITTLRAALAQEVQCPRCGKVTKPDDIHTCSPRRLTDEVIADLWAKNGTYHHHFARAIERWLRGEG